MKTTKLRGFFSRKVAKWSDICMTDDSLQGLREQLVQKIHL